MTTRKYPKYGINGNTYMPYKQFPKNKMNGATQCL